MGLVYLLACTEQKKQCLLRRVGETRNVNSSSTVWAQDCMFCQHLFRYTWPYWRKLYDESGFCRIFLKKENQYMLLLIKIPIIFKNLWFSVGTFLWCLFKVWQELIFLPHQFLSSYLHPVMCTTCRTIFPLCPQPLPSPGWDLWEVSLQVILGKLQ